MHEIPSVREQIKVYDKSKQQTMHLLVKNYLYVAIPFLLCHASIEFDQMVQFKV